MPTKLIALFFAILFCHTAFGQQVTIREIRRQPNTDFYNDQGFTIQYPIIYTGNAQVDKKINAVIRYRIFVLEDGDIVPVEKLLTEDIKSGLLISLSYKVTYQRNGIYSIIITKEGCGAYCSTSVLPFNFNISTGKLYQFEDLFQKDKMATIRDTLLNQKHAALAEYRNDMDKELKNDEVDRDTYKWAMEIVSGDCKDSVSTENFSINGTDIEVFDGFCDFPHAIQGQAPVYNLRCIYTNTGNLLEPGIKSKLINP